MTKSLQKTSAISLNLFNILIICCLMISCASNRVADVNEHSSQYAYKGKIHSVGAGETLFSIAWKYGVDYKKLADFNGIKPPYTIYPSQKIRIDIRSFNNKNNSSNLSANRTDKTAASGQGRINSSTANRSEYRSNNVSKSTNYAGLEGSPKWQWPVPGKLIALFQGDFGMNKGIDLSGKLGEPVLAAASGRVVYAGSGLSGYGKLLIIKHNETFLSAYAHNDEISVKEGDLVKVGQRVADMGSSGTDRVKLHFEIRSEGSPVDPLKYLPKRQ